MTDHEPTRGFIAVPPEGHTTAYPGEQYGPLTQDEWQQVSYLRAAQSGLDETLTLQAMRVVHDGVARVALVAVKDVGDELLATPIALLLDAALFEGIAHAVPGPIRVERDD